jgi:hypothetical protein
MKSPLRLLGWLLVGCGVAVATLALMTHAGGAPLGVNVLGPSVFTASGRQAWIAGSCFAVAFGAIVLRATRRDYIKRREA